MATSSPPVTTAIGDREALTATGVGDPLSEPELLQQLDSFGFTADASNDFYYYADPTPYPFVNVVNGRLASVAISRGPSESTTYTYLFDLAPGQTLEAAADAAAAPLVAEYPDYTTWRDSHNVSLQQEVFTVELRGPGEGWTVSASTLEGSPTVGIVEYFHTTFADRSKAPPTGSGLVSAAFLPTVEGVLEELALPTSNVTAYRHSAGVGPFQRATGGVPPDNTLSIEVVFPDRDYATVAEMLTPLADSGWTFSESDYPSERLFYSRGPVDITLIDPYFERRGRPTTVYIWIDLNDDPIERPGGR